jgi:hypothetical protein
MGMRGQRFGAVRISEKSATIIKVKHPLLSTSRASERERGDEGARFGAVRISENPAVCYYVKK